MKPWNTFVFLACLSLALGGCSALDSLGDKIDTACATGTLTTTQSYVDNFNAHLASKGRKFRIDGITCLE